MIAPFCGSVLSVGELRVTVVRSKRKTLSLTVSENGEVIARAPNRMSERAIAAFVTEKRAWLSRATARARQARAEATAVGCLTEEELARLKAAARVEFPARVAYYAEKMGISYGCVSVRLQKTRWGSCSAAGNLNFNALLMLAPPEVRDSVVVHELCHRKELNHSRRFYALLYATMPDYERRHCWLKEHGAALQARVKREN